MLCAMIVFYLITTVVFNQRLKYQFIGICGHINQREHKQYLSFIYLQGSSYNIGCTWNTSAKIKVLFRIKETRLS